MARAESELQMSFEQIEQVIDGSLPASAQGHSAWWANEVDHVPAAAWMAAGWRVDHVDRQVRSIRFRRG